MLKTRWSILFIFIVIALFITGCEKLNASMDGVDKNSEKALGSASEAAPAPEPQAKENKSDSITGNAAAEVEEPQVATHTVKMTVDGFSPDKLYIKVGDTVVWKNVRSGSINKAMIIGVRECNKVRSGILKAGESFSWTFTEPMTCTIADGIMTTKESKVFVE